MPEWSGVSPGLYSLSNSGLLLTSMSLLRLKSVTDPPPSSASRNRSMVEGWRRFVAGQRRGSSGRMKATLRYASVAFVGTTSRRGERSLTSTGLENAEQPEPHDALGLVPPRSSEVRCPRQVALQPGGQVALKLGSTDVVLQVRLETRTGT